MSEGTAYLQVDPDLAARSGLTDAELKELMEMYLISYLVSVLWIPIMVELFRVKSYKLSC